MNEQMKHEREIIIGIGDFSFFSSLPWLASFSFHLLSL
jgi:hypothetical protein